VPSGYHDGLQLSESLSFDEYVNEILPHNPLLPSSTANRFRARYFIEKNNYKMIVTHYKFLKETDKSQWPALSVELLAILKDISKDLSLHPTGPFFFGSHFTLTDIAYFPFIERIQVLLGHYRHFIIPQTEEYAALHRWYAACSERPTVKITIGQRLEGSLKLYPFESIERKEYLLEVYEGYANNCILEMKKQLVNATPGKRSFNLEAALKEKNQNQNNHAVNKA